MWTMNWMCWDGLWGESNRKRAKTDTTRSATEVGPRPVEAGLGGHDAGVSWVDDGVGNASFPLLKRAWTAVSECVTFSDFRDVDNEIIGEKQNSKRASERQEGFLCNKHGVLFSQSNAVHNPSVNQTNNSSSVLMKPHSEKTKQNQKIRYDIL